MVILFFFFVYFLDNPNEVKDCKFLPYIAQNLSSKLNNECFVFNGVKCAFAGGDEFMCFSVLFHVQAVPNLSRSMLPNHRKITFKFTRPGDGFPDSSFLRRDDNTRQELIDVSSSSSSSLGDDSSEDENGHSSDASKQLVLYDPAANGALVPVPEPTTPFQNSRHKGSPIPNQQRVLPSVGAFTVQCANCFKWRLIPTKEKYEEIREHILEQPFYCKTAREWRPDISCDDPADISQDGSRLWAIDKPNIAQPPPGWQRLLRIRGEGSTKFADVYEPVSRLMMMMMMMIVVVTTLSNLFPFYRYLTFPVSFII